MITTQKALRQEFWDRHPQYKRGTKRVYSRNVRIPKTQNEYPTDTRVAWCDFVEHMQRSGEISEALAQRATL